MLQSRELVQGALHGLKGLAEHLCTLALLPDVGVLVSVGLHLIMDGLEGKLGLRDQRTPARGAR